MLWKAWMLAMRDGSKAPVRGGESHCTVCSGLGMGIPLVGSLKGFYLFELSLVLYRARARLDVSRKLDPHYHRVGVGKSKTSHAQPFHFTASQIEETKYGQHAQDNTPPPPRLNIPLPAHPPPRNLPPLHHRRRNLLYPLLSHVHLSQPQTPNPRPMHRRAHHHREPSNRTRNKPPPTKPPPLRTKPMAISGSMLLAKLDRDFPARTSLESLSPTLAVYCFC